MGGILVTSRKSCLNRKASAGGKPQFPSVFDQEHDCRYGYSENINSSIKSKMKIKIISENINKNKILYKNIKKISKGPKRFNPKRSIK